MAGLSPFGQCSNYHKLQRKPKTFLQFKDAPQLTRSALPEKDMDDGVKDYGR